HPVASFLLGAPFVVQRQFLDSPRTQSGWEYGAFVQDDIKVTSRLTLNLGLRYDYYQPFVEEEDRQADLDLATVTMKIAGKDIHRGIYQASKTSFQPRLGFAYSLTKDAKTALRGGYAIGSFNEYNSTLSVSGRTYQNPPFFFNASVANGLFGGGPPRFTLSGGPPLPQPVDPNNPTGDVIDFPSELENAYVQSWNLNLQRALPREVLVDIAYAGAKGTHLVGIRNINQTLPNPAIPGSEFGGSPRISPRLGLILHHSGWANSIYHALQFKAQRRFSQGLWFLASYTYSHSIDDQSNGVIPNNATLVRPQDSFNTKADRANSTYDIRNRFVFSYVYDLPIGEGRRFLRNLPTALDHILGGWVLTGILTLQDGSHFTPAVSVNNPSGIQLRPDRVGDGNLPAERRTVDRWFDLSAFALPARDANGNFFRFGNAGRNILVTPGFSSLDFGLQKKLALYEDVKLECRADFFNLLNHPNFGVPNAAIDAPTGGRITTIRGTPRQIQLALRLTF
ncbi:MAG: TonB-dependent receptor, partial [Acidobacteria bacterium]|nr:TonB-dependent receptor [Acidobacteriota bacterium]